MAADDAADDLLVQRPAHIGLARDDVWCACPAATQATRATPIARARTAAAALADGAKVAKADGAFAGTTAARPGTNQTKTAHAVGFTDLVANQATQHILRIVPGRCVATENGSQVRALGHLQHAEDAGILGLLFRKLLGQVRVRVVLGALEAVETLLVLGGLLPHLAFLTLVPFALAALFVGPLLLEPLRNLLFLFLGRLD